MAELDEKFCQVHDAAVVPHQIPQGLVHNLVLWRSAGGQPVSILHVKTKQHSLPPPVEGMAQLFMYENHMLPANGEASDVSDPFVPPINLRFGCYFRYYYNPVMRARLLAQALRGLYRMGNDNFAEVITRGCAWLE